MISQAEIQDLTEKLAIVIYETEATMASMEGTASPFYVRSVEHSNLCEIIEYRNQSLSVRAAYYEAAQEVLKRRGERTGAKVN